MKADAKKIKWLLDNEKQKSIERETGVAQSKLSRIKSGDINRITSSSLSRLASVC